MMKAAIQNTKLKRHEFQSSNKNIQGTHHRLIRCGGRKKKRGGMMTAAIQNTKKETHLKRKIKRKINKTQVSIIKEKHSRCTPATNQGCEEKKRGVMMKAAIQNTK